MRWTPGRRSRNIEDRRGEPGRRRSPFPFPFPGRGGGRARLPGGRVQTGRAPKLSLTGLIVLAAAAWFFGADVFQILGGAGLETRVPAQFPEVSTRAPERTGAPAASPDEERLVDFVSFVLDDLQTTWVGLLPGYREAKLVLFRDAVRSGCGSASAQMGPFYCPADEKVYIDLDFYDDLHRRFGAPGDFAQAYVLAHEIGHHIQKLAGVESQVRQSQRQRPRDANALSVRMELQADCLAGVWGHSTGRRDILERGDVEEGLKAAAAIGDDRIQGMTSGRVHPESFTHGSSRQRVSWFRRGLESGDPERCDTFALADP